MIATHPAQAAIEAFVQERFLNKYLIPIRDYLATLAESYGAARNRISAGTFELPVIRHRSRNFVTAVDLIKYLLELQEQGASVSVAQPVAKSAQEENEQGSMGCRCKYSPEAKARAAARAAASWLKRQAAAAKARAAKQEKLEGGAA